MRILGLLLCIHMAMGVDEDRTYLLDTNVVEISGFPMMYGSSGFDNNWAPGLPLKEEKLIGDVVVVKEFGCSEYEQDIKDKIVYIRRGNCSFAEKAKWAGEGGAIALLVGGTKESIVAQMENLTVSDEIELALLVNCDENRNFPVGESEVAISDADRMCSTKCKSKQCVALANSEFCCMWDVPDIMGFGGTMNEESKIPVVRLTVADGTRVESNDKYENVVMYRRKAVRVDPSSFIVWMLATMTVAYAAYRSARKERYEAKKVMAEYETMDETPEKPMEVDDTETLELTKMHAFGFLVFGSAFLLVLYYWNVVVVVIAMFAFGSVNAIAQIIIVPAFRYVSEKVGCMNNMRKSFRVPCLDQISIMDVLTFFMAVGIVVWWVLERHANYSWVLQNIFGMCFCIFFLYVIRMNSIKVATLLLTLVFIYDVFFVFISPLFFEESVMIKAAKGGNQKSSTAPFEYCLRYPLNTDYHCLKEKIPILLRLPKVTDWQHGEVMLGLGDIVLPGLLVAFAARYDYITRGNIWGKVRQMPGATILGSNQASALEDVQVHVPDSSTLAAPKHCPGKFGYYIWMCIGYAVGLLLANIAVIVMEQGQPALLYLVPTTLGLLLILSKFHGTTASLWHGVRDVNANTESPVRQREEATDST